MKSNISCKKLNGSTIIASSLLVLTVAFASQGHAATVVVGTPIGGVYVAPSPVYYGYGYRHGVYGYGTAYHRGYGYGHGTAYHHGYHGNTVYHHGRGHGTVVHNGHVHHYRR